MKTKLSLEKINGKDKLIYTGKGNFSLPLSYLDLLLNQNNKINITIKPKKFYD